ncbi:MAG: riboflavin biosynthesis protein RibF [Flavobacteriales bacterium]|nr:riboflavin biosynthesis protein RibF [Flavobacteriales bacterium]
MRVHADIAKIRDLRRPVLTTGTFDGVHRGHRMVLDRLLELARREQGESVLLTFHPHPRMVLFPEHTDLKLLNTPQEKAALLEAAGLDHLLMTPFSRAFSNLSAEDYVREILVKAIGVHAVVIGHDHRFGRDRSGDLSLLASMGPHHGFRVEEIPAHEVDHITVSSTKIRHALAEGEVAVARELLGYGYPLSGVVVKGDQLGRTLGFPTANIGAIDPHKLVPGDGVYAVSVELRTGTFQGMLYIGQRPTVPGGAGKRVVEVNIFGLDEAYRTGERDLYGEAITVRFMHRIRGDMRFTGLEALKEQLARDREAALARPMAP